jgi:hypothetical protein
LIYYEKNGSVNIGKKSAKRRRNIGKKRDATIVKLMDLKIKKN